tara:strand:+ start:336 stop:515 length:180 start_codon:yes stop_codon:yes gene_type:complete
MKRNKQTQIQDLFLKKQSVNAAPAKRTCLYCQKEFQSEWTGNRLCKKCKNLSEFSGSAR